MKYPQAWFFFLTSSRRPGSLQTRNVHALQYSPENTGVEYAPLDVPPSELNEDLISIPLTPQKDTGLHSLPGGRPLLTYRASGSLFWPHYTCHSPLAGPCSRQPSGLGAAFRKTSAIVYILRQVGARFTCAPKMAGVTFRTESARYGDGQGGLVDVISARGRRSALGVRRLIICGFLSRLINSASPTSALFHSAPSDGRLRYPLCSTNLRLPVFL